MNILCEVSLGELVDKLTILEIKMEKISDQVKLDHISKELSVLSSKLNSLKLIDLDPLKAKLRTINLELWDIEDNIRLKEKKVEFDEEFISLARAVYQTNDRRFLAKDAINEKYGSQIREMKSYEDY